MNFRPLLCFSGSVESSLDSLFLLLKHRYLSMLTSHRARYLLKQVIIDQLNSANNARESTPCSISSLLARSGMDLARELDDAMLVNSSLKRWQESYISDLLDALSCGVTIYVLSHEKSQLVEKVPDIVDHLTTVA
jgi:hypothetical protein